MEASSHVIIALLFFAALCGWALFFFVGRKLKSLKKKYDAVLPELQEHRKNIHKYEVENRDVYLNPHIFKNTLNAIRNYAFKTHLALDKLGGVLDYILYDSKVSFTSLREEIEFIQDFIELNRFRLNPLLDFRIAIEADKHHPLYEKKLILPLTTVDFIENAFKHGDLSGQDGFVRILLKLDETGFRYEVVNAINPNPVISMAKGGLGQGKLRERLEMIYPGNYELMYLSEDNVYKAMLKLDLYEIDRKMYLNG